MRRFSSIAATLSLAASLAPVSAFAASATATVSEEDVLNVLESESGGEDMMMDRGGGGIYYPGPYGGGITIDASVTTEVTPDYIGVNGYCEVTDLGSREDVRTALAKLFNDIKADVGTDGRVRRSGQVSVYPYYDPYTGGTREDRMSGSLSVFIRVTKPGSAQRVSDVLDKHLCSPSWDVRLVDAEDHEIELLDKLLAKVNKRKTVFEKLLKKKLTNVTGASLSTWLDGWSSYDPVTNKADATTTLTITFDIGTRARVTPTIDATSAPKG